MNRPSLLPATNSHLRSILLTLLLACLLIAATLWVYQKRIERLPQKLHGSTAPAISSALWSQPAPGPEPYRIHSPNNTRNMKSIFTAADAGQGKHPGSIQPKTPTNPF